jgi:hypothetical protein
MQYAICNMQYAMYELGDSGEFCMTCNLQLELGEVRIASKGIGGHPRGI